MPSCPAQCKRGCFCKEEFVRDVRINECVPLSTCANIPVDGLCEDDEVFEDCNVCEPSCEDPNPICPAQCRRGCFCRQGLFRDLQTDRCVLRTSCTNKKDGRKKEKECEDDEVFKHCGICEPTCDNPKPICPAQCKRGCFCKEEFVRDVITNKCVPLSMCANIPVDELCEDDEVFEHCRACEPSCEDPNPICPAQCRRGCFCRPGFFRDLQTKRCVHRTSCTNRKDDKKKEEECEDNEVFRQCGICEPTCYSLRPPCPDPCKQGCFCREEFVRNVRTNKCVPPSKCSNIPVDGLCEDDEVFEHCRVCEPSCEDPNPVCPAQCRRGCFCKEGRFRDLQTDRCVYRTSCTNSV